MVNEQSKNRTGRWLNRAMWSLMFTPLLLLLVFISLGWHVRLGLGHWPEAMKENYDTPAFKLHEQVFRVTAVLIVWAVIPLWAVMVCIARFRHDWSAKRHVAQAAVILAAWGIVATFAAWDPWRFLAWILD